MIKEIKGRPTSSTHGSVGDILTDVITGKQYKCKFAYTSSVDGTVYEWEEMKANPFAQKAFDKLKPVVEEKVEAEPKVEETPVEEVSEEKATEEPVVEEKTATKSKRTNYSKQYKNN